MTIAPVVFSSVTRPLWDRIKRGLSAEGAPITSDQGEAAVNGLRITWGYDAKSQTLTVACTTDLPPMMAELVKARLNATFTRFTDPKEKTTC